MKFKNKIIESLKIKKPVFYISTNNFCYEEGKKLRNTWADYIRLDIEHGPFNTTGIQAFMRGLVGDDNYTNNSQLPAVIAELPFTGRSLEEVKACMWMAHHILATGVHGLLLCHAECEKAARELVRGVRYPIHTPVDPFSENFGLRGHGGSKFASCIWGVEEHEYITLADIWPLNEHGQLLVGVKMENPRAAANCEEVISVPGIAFGEWGLGDMALCYGHTQRPTFPLPENLATIREKIWSACNRHGRTFLGICDDTNIKQNIDNNMLMIRCYNPKHADIGKEYYRQKIKS